ncbi:hypothetical protein CCACVL1_02862 [Corchorus capsularis]|uniref:B box-type domain-containing protein n=1 Tax=Corchorus capsularis TaxID=210143 RepID=A0A1R3K570_COCAP|nr:hypothetical protein CCACVL1_02862 [Corchorus capsularis]
MGKENGGGASSIPHWLTILLGEKFFDPCLVHQSEKKNEKNIFCLSCCTTLCPHCLPVHRPHRRLQIRRYVYQDVIRLNDAQKIINCSLVQPYTTNSAKVVFLNERPMSRPFRGSGNLCINCDRSLQDPFLFCSLSCKVNHLKTAKHGGKKLDQSDRQMTPDSVLDSPVSKSVGSHSSTCTSNGGNGSAINCKSSLLACTATTEFVNKIKKKRSHISMRRISCRQEAAAAAESISRRKGVPHRSPLN